MCWARVLLTRKCPSSYAQERRRAYLCVFLSGMEGVPNLRHMLKIASGSESPHAAEATSPGATQVLNLAMVSLKFSRAMEDQDHVSFCSRKGRLAARVSPQPRTLTLLPSPRSSTHPGAKVCWVDV